MAKNLTIKLEIENIGPHTKMVFKDETSSGKNAIFANNGSGKTFISRLFRLIEKPTILNSDRLLSFGKDEGRMKFEFINTEAKKEDSPILELKIKRGFAPIVSPLPYIFHVFNSDYVQENIETSGYRPNGNIEGYILGKEQIDLSKEKKELEDKNKELNKKNEDLRNRLNDKKIALDDKNLGIKKNILEYANFTFENIFKKDDLGYIEKKSFEELKRESVSLNELPDDLKDVKSNNSDIKIDFLEDIKEVLKHSYSKSDFDEGFKAKIKSKQDFIKNGLNVCTDDNKCPFCEQLFDDNALKLINIYNQYLNDEEAKIIEKINTFIKKIDELKHQFESIYKKSLEVKNDFDNLKKYILSSKEENIEILQNLEELEDNFKSLYDGLNDKKNDISKSINIEENIKNIEVFKNKNNSIVADNDKKIKLINIKKNNIDTEKLDIKKRLCKAKYLETLEAETINIDEIKSLEKEIEKIQKDIADKENKVKSSKKDKVIEIFEYFLNVFFSDKYTFDRENFCLKFDSYNLTDNASNVLSDGEKSIVAFCFFLAETHTKVEVEADYEKLFFVIDDPISSLDFHYVYSVTQVIRRLNETDQFPIPGDKKPRFLILTHNIEFMSILIRNKIIDGNFILENSNIKALQKELIMPYEEHLRDVYEVSMCIKKPSHTTPNSIRHILETINKFERPDLNFLKYCENIELLKGDNEFLYGLIHDNSHGNYRSQISNTPDMIIRGCKKVIEVISSKFNGQIEVIKANCNKNE